MVGLAVAHRAAAAAPDAVVRLDGVGMGGVLADITLRIARGERVVLLGRNGIGKTTLLRTMAGLLAPDRGTVETAAPLGYVPQNYRMCLFPWFRVRTNLALAAPGRTPAEVLRQVEQALERVPLAEGLLDRFPSRLSGGEQQLVALARALVGKPAILLLDEPFSALDAPARLRLRRTLRDGLCGITLLLVSHDLDDAAAVADRALLLDGKPARVVGDLSLLGARPEDARQRLAARLGALS